MASSNQQLILSAEAEAYIDGIKQFELSEIGGKQWAKQHEYIEKLNIQAVLSASTNGDEFVKEYLVSYDKMPYLIQNLITVEIWKEKIFPELTALSFKPKTTFPIFIILYNEAVLANLLETVLFHRECTEALETVVIDLVDYTYRKIIACISKLDKGSSNDTNSKKYEFEDNMEDLRYQMTTLEFNIALKAVSILHYIIEHMDCLPLSVMNRLLNTYDTPILFLSLIQNSPWTRHIDGKTQKYIDNKWVDVQKTDFKLTKTEGQVWIALFHLLMTASCQQKYEMNDYRKNMILKLRSYLMEVIVDQLPILTELQRYLEHLSFLEPAPTKKQLILEQVPELRAAIMKKYEGQWTEIAEKQIEEFFSREDDLKKQAMRWVDTYNSSLIDELISEPPICVVCGDAATKRCSRCESEWYCRRECQVTHWNKHKKFCNMIEETQKKLKNQSISN